MRTERRAVLFSFSKKFRPLILSGDKTQTIRIWKKCWLREGSVVLSPGLGRLKIQEITELGLAELTNEDALRDGFKDRQALFDVLRKIYRFSHVGAIRCYRIRFKYMGDGGQGRGVVAGARPGRKPGAAEGSPSKAVRPAGSKKRSPRSQAARTSQRRLFPPTALQCECR